MRNFYKKINFNVRGLQWLGMLAENYGDLLLPREIGMQVAQMNVTDKWSIDEILEIVQIELEANEISANMAAVDKRILSQGRTPAGTRAFVVTNNSG